MDLCGPMRIEMINRKKYILVIVDDFSRFIKVYFLHTKDETLEIIKKFIAQVQLKASIHDTRPTIEIIELKKVKVKHRLSRTTKRILNCYSSNDYKEPSVFDDDQYEKEIMPVHDTDIEDVIEEEE
ncbi:putative ribonuclease H-like domain-containing protein [Tanacetum coccineum]